MRIKTKSETHVKIAVESSEFLNGRIFFLLVALFSRSSLSTKKQASLFAALQLLSAVRLVRMLKRLATDDETTVTSSRTLTHTKRPTDQIFYFNLTFCINRAVKNQSNVEPNERKKEETGTESFCFDLACATTSNNRFCHLFSLKFNFV